MANTNSRLTMRDGALFELGPHSRFSIDDYAYQGEDSLIDPVTAPMPEGFLDMNRDITQITVADRSWWQKILDLF